MNRDFPVVKSEDEALDLLDSGYFLLLEPIDATWHFRKMRNGKAFDLRYLDALLRTKLETERRIEKIGKMGGYHRMSIKKKA